MPTFAALSEPLAETIRTRAFSALPAASTGSVTLSLAPVLYPAGHTFDLVERQLVTRQDSALVFVDEVPGANWGHPCRYQFYDAASGELVQDDAAQFPPNLDPATPLLEAFHQPFAFPEFPSRKIFEPLDWAKIYDVSHLPSLHSDERYAILWTSQISNRRHVEDLELAYRTLVEVYGFRKGNILVLCYDGTLGSTDFPAVGNWDGDQSTYKLKIDYPATEANLQTAFDALAPRLTANSLLFVHTNNHGSTSGLCIDSGSVVLPTTFGTMIAGLPALGELIVTMEQCYAGAFQQPTLDNSTASRTVFVAAVPSTKVSAGAAHFDPWARHFFEALRGATAYGAALPSDPDANGRGGVSMREAADYAVTRNDNMLDDPQFADKPYGCGADIYLGKISFQPGWWHHLLDGLEERVPVRIPDPGPVEFDFDPLRHIDAQDLAVHSHLVGLAKSLARSNGRYAGAR